MKILEYLFMAATLGLAVTACDDDHKPDWNDPVAYDVNATALSVADGTTGVPATTTTIEVTYDAKIVINPAVEVTLNDAAVPTEVQDDNRLVATVELRKGQNYTFVVPTRAVTGVGSMTFAPEVRISFSTEAVPGIDKTKIASAPINSNATAEAKKLYSFLLENYGTRQLSGAMGAVGWGTEFSDFVASSAGKYPAIIGFDYLHLPSSPSSWIDYGDITPVRTIWEAGSIPAVTWHWNVPASTDGDNVSFNPNPEVFSAANVLVSGTWENQIATADVAKLAGYLRLLQDAGIPVLFRPFHEAAGDYVWGSWFWWGNSGVEVTKDLWKWLYTTLTDEYGLNNLIWVWTMQLSAEGKPADISLVKGAYPGDQYVDIVGTDLYVDALSDQSASFHMIQEAVDGNKIIALTETGNLLDPESQIQNGTLWSFFMGWYEQDDNGPLFKEWNTNGEWGNVLNHSSVLNQGDFNLK